MGKIQHLDVTTQIDEALCLPFRELWQIVRCRPDIYNDDRLFRFSTISLVVDDVVVVYLGIVVLVVGVISRRRDHI